MNNELKSNFKFEESSPKKFGITFFIIFFIISIFTYIYFDKFFLIPLIVGFSFLLISFISPNSLKKFSKIWFKFGVLLGKIISPLIMFLIYLIGIIPTSIYAKITQKKILDKKFDKKTKTYWVTRKDALNSMKSQF